MYSDKLSEIKESLYEDGKILKGETLYDTQDKDLIDDEDRKFKLRKMKGKIDDPLLNFKRLRIFDELIRRRFQQNSLGNKPCFLYPAGRHDALNLKKWFQMMMKNIKKLKLETNREYFEYC